MWRVLGGLLALAVVVALAGAVGAWLWLRTGLPDPAGQVALPDLSAPVEVVRDADAVPHIFAATMTDAYVALGYLHAQDRLWQMDLQRRIGAGRLAELLGEEALRLDRFMRVLDLYRQAEASLQALSPEVRQALEAYSAGVNAWIAGRRGALPPEFYLLRYRPEPWRPADSLVWGKLMALQLSGNYRSELLRARLLQHLGPERVADLFPGYPADAPVTLVAGLAGIDLERLWAALPPPLGPATASNEWVLSGAHTDTGKPILANDPHLGLGAPVLWYLSRIETPELSLAGATVPGVPFHLLGHNGTIAWGFTTTGTDVQDLFVERIDPADPGRYLTPDGPRRFETRSERIAVRGGEDVTLTVRTTRHGPVISDIVPEAAAAAPEGHVLALAFTALDDADTTAEAIYRLNRAHNWEAFRTALRHYRAPHQNIVYADTAGRIGFLAPARVPIRASGDGQVPVPGWTGTHDWTGTIPFEELPQRVDPPSGRIINANNAIVGPDYPHFLTRNWEAHHRATRLEEVLAAPGPYSVADMAALQMDSVSPAARDLLPVLLSIEPETALQADALRQLRGWDGRMDRRRPEPLIFHAWLRELNRALYADELGPLFADFWDTHADVVLHLMTHARHWCDDSTTPETVEDCPAILRASLARSLHELSEAHGPHLVAWRWGMAHRAPLRHQVFGRIPGLRGLTDIGIDTDGGPYTVNRGTFNLRDARQPFAHVHGAGFRAVYDLSDLGRSRFVIATGQSGHPLSPHYGDFVARWRNGASVTLTGTAEEVAARGLGRLRLTPEATP